MPTNSRFSEPVATAQEVGVSIQHDLVLLLFVSDQLQCLLIQLMLLSISQELLGRSYGMKMRKSLGVLG